MYMYMKVLFKILSILENNSLVYTSTKYNNPFKFFEKGATCERHSIPVKISSCMHGN